ncbi:MAG TPA: hypothetical protein VK157_14975 [Phycisphaerales bacterium]|nr:hypothetical protein [Phycisphaerales bacterium]
MSQMSNPYAALQRDDLLIERKVSVMAIVALVVAILGFVVCIIPGLAGLGALLGVAALVIISQSDGRVGGRGLAIAAIVLGLLMTIFQIGLAIGIRQTMSKANTAFFGPLGGIMTEAEKKDLAKVQTYFTKPAADRITQAHVDAFADGVQAELGAFKGVPQGMFPLFSAYSQLGPIMQQFQGRNGSGDVIPVPVEFENGLALLAVQVDQSGKTPPPAGIMIPLINAKIITASGKGFTLYPGAKDDPNATSTSGEFPPRPVLPNSADAPAETEPKPDADADPGSDAAPTPPSPAEETPSEPKKP